MGHSRNFLGFHRSDREKRYLKLIVPAQKRTVGTKQKYSHTA